jgi:hypothetical protein
MSVDQPAEMPAAPRLRCLGGQQAPPEVGADLAVLPMLPLAARRQFYRVLGPCLAEPVPNTMGATLDEFCREFHVDAEVLARVLKASRFVLREASIADLSEADLAKDLATLGDTGEITNVLSPGYEMVKQVVRAEVARGALADHGKVVERVAWRMDQVTSSNRGGNLSISVGVLTLWYRDGERLEQVTVQFPPDAQQELREMCARFV